jgi:hypothetical protein
MDANHEVDPGLSDEVEWDDSGCAEYVNGSCAARACNYTFFDIDPSGLLEDYVFKPCVLNKKYGQWAAGEGGRG